MQRAILGAVVVIALAGAARADAAGLSGTRGTKPVADFIQSSAPQREVPPAHLAPRFGTKPVLWASPAPSPSSAVQAQDSASRSQGDKAALWTIRGR